MKSLVIAVLLLAGLLTASTSALAVGNAAMVVDQTGGSAWYRSGDREGKSVELMDFLLAGEKLELGAGATLVLNYFASGRREEVRGPGTITVGPSASGGLEGVRIQVTTLDPLLKDVVASSSQHFGTVALRNLSGPTDGLVLDRLCNTAIRPGPVHLGWGEVSGAKTYHVTIESARKGKLKEWDAAVPGIDMAGDFLVYGESYTWTVTALAGARTIATGQGRFRVISQEKLTNVEAVERYIFKALPKGSTEALVALAQLYQKYELNDEARAILLKLEREHPDNPNIKEQLSVLEANFQP
jgi:hypothetical protein